MLKVMSRLTLFCFCVVKGKKQKSGLEKRTREVYLWTDLSTPLLILTKIGIVSLLGLLCSLTMGFLRPNKTAFEIFVLFSQRMNHGYAILCPRFLIIRSALKS